MPIAQAEQAVPEQGPLPPVVLDVARVALDYIFVLRFLDVVKHVAELNGPESHQHRAVRIAFLVGERVVLPVDRHPFLRRQPRRQPQRKPEHPRDRRVQLERAMRGAAVQVDGGAHDGNLRDESGDDETENEGKQHSTTLRKPAVSGNLNENRGGLAARLRPIVSRKPCRLDICVSRHCTRATRASARIPS